MYTGKLKDFQQEGMDFLLDKGDALCAYEMGLGKTHVTMAALEEVNAFPALIICPNYLKWKWYDEIGTWTDSPVVVVEGTKKKRIEQQYEEFESGYLVINYELVLQDWEILKRFLFVNITCDEITRLKGYQSKTKRAIKKLRTKSKWGLTGTPIGNRPDELYSIMDWIFPSLFGKWWTFDAAYIERGYFKQVVCYKNLQQLSKIASQRMISKSQEDVSDELPEVVYEDIPLTFTKPQKKLYIEIASSLKDYLDVMVSTLISDEEADTDKITALIRQRFSALRQATISPMLLERSDTKYVNGLSSSFADLGPKIPAVLSLIEEAEHKIVVFSFFRGVVEYLSTVLSERNISYRLIEGGMNSEEIYKRAKEFQTDPNIKVFLTTDAGEKGIDLQSAKYLINVDVPQSFEKFDQRAGRIKRIGSKHDTVFIYNLYVRDSFEERQLSGLKAKNRLADAIQGYNDVDYVVPNEMTLREFLGATL